LQTFAPAPISLLPNAYCLLPTDDASQRIPMRPDIAALADQISTSAALLRRRL